MIEVQKIHHITIATKNLEKAKEFYSEILGFKEIERPQFNLMVLGMQ